MTNVTNAASRTTRHVSLTVALIYLYTYEGQWPVIKFWV